MNIVKRVEEALDELIPSTNRHQFTVGAVLGAVVVTRDRPSRHCRSWYIPSGNIDRVRDLAVYVNSFIGARPNVRPTFR